MFPNIQQASSGFYEYMLEGRRSDSIYTRDEKDNVIHVGGDLEDLNKAIQFTDKNFDWKHNYWHLTFGFTERDWDILSKNDKKLNELITDYLEYLLPNTKITNLIFSADVHEPKIKYETDLSTGEERLRLPHLHLCISKLDVINGKQLRMNPFKLKAEQAHQRIICKRLGLDNPADHLREHKLTRAAIISRFKADDSKYQTKAARTNKIRDELISSLKIIEHEFKTPADVVTAIRDMGVTKDITFSKTGVIKLIMHDDFDCNRINVTGKRFTFLDHILNQSRDNKVIHEIKTDEELRAESIANFVKNEQLRAPKVKSPGFIVRHDKKIERIAKFAESLSKEQQSYYLLYEDKIEEKLISGFKVFEAHNAKYLTNNDRGINIMDRPKNITCRVPKDEQALRDTITLSLKIAQSKGWDLTTLNVKGASNKYIAEMDRQVKELVDGGYKKPIQKNHTPRTLKPKPIGGLLGQTLKERDEHNYRKVSAESIKAMKVGLPPAIVLQYASDRCRIDTTRYQVIDDKIKDLHKPKTKPKNVIDFLTKDCHLTLKESLPHLEDLLIRHDLERAKSPELQKNPPIIASAPIYRKNDIIVPLDEQKQQEAPVGRSHADIIKEDLDANYVLRIMCTRFGLNKADFEVTSSNKINCLGNSAKPKSLYDFMRDHCFTEFKAASIELDKLYENQLKDQIPIATVIKTSLDNGYNMQEMIQAVLKHVEHKGIKDVSMNNSGIRIGKNVQDNVSFEELGTTKQEFLAKLSLNKKVPKINLDYQSLIELN